MAVTTNLAITLLEQAQAQKEVTANAAITDLDQAKGFFVKGSLTGGTVNLTTDEAQNGVISLTGTLTSNLTVVVPTGVSKYVLFINNTTGAFTTQVRMTAGGTLFTVPQGAALLLLSTTRAELFITAAYRDLENLTFNAATATWAAQPAALTEFLGLTDRRNKFDLTNYSQARLIANVEVIGAAGATLRGEFSTTDGGTYAALDNSTGPNVSLATAGTIVSSFVSLTAAAKADVFLRIVGVGGDGATSPQIGLVALQFK